MLFTGLREASPLDGPDEIIYASATVDALEELANVQIFSSPSLNSYTISQSGTVSSSIQTTNFQLPQKVCRKYIAAIKGSSGKFAKIT